ncbi:MAG: extracellular solute-binding protein [Chloroflexi bacterium]|nr:extracellular solute-binding protein [Chloroflexota bacterium]
MKLKLWLLVMVGVLLVTAGCTPTSPAPDPLAPAATPVTLVPASNLPPTSQDAAWQKLIEAARKEGKLVMYSFSFTGDVGVQLAAAFKQQYGISMEIVTGPGAQMIERIKVEQRTGQVLADVMEGSNTNASLAQQDGLSENYGELPVLREKDVWLIPPDTDPGRHIIYYSPLLTGPWINSNLVKKDEAPRSWRQLLEPRWQGKLIASDPDITPSPNVFFVMLRKHLGFDDKYFAELGKQKLALVPTAWQAPSALARGEAQLLIASPVLNVTPLLQEKAPVLPIDMEEGLFGRSQALNIIKNGPHPNASRLFLNWMLTKEGQAVQARAKTVLPLRKDIPDFTPEQGRITPRKIFVTTIEDELDIARAQREKTFRKVLGY